MFLPEGDGVGEEDEVWIGFMHIEGHETCEMGKGEADEGGSELASGNFK